MITVKIWTDGAITGNGTPESVGAWAAILQVEMAGEIHEKIIVGVKHNTTNNEMELMAVYKALRALDPAWHADMNIQLYSDSEYCTKAFCTHGRARKYEFDGWPRKPNIDLIREIYELTQFFNISFHHIGRELNARADELAVAAKEEELKRIGRFKRPRKQTKAASQRSI